MKRRAIPTSLAVMVALMALVCGAPAQAESGRGTIYKVTSNGGDPATYTLTVNATTDVTVGDHLFAYTSASSGLWEVTAKTATTITIEDSLTEEHDDEDFGAPSATAPRNVFAFSTPTPTTGLSRIPDSSIAYASAALRRNAYLTQASAQTHALLSAAHSDTTTAAVARGALIVGQGASPTWQRYTIGASGRYLRSDGTDALWAVLNMDDASSGTLAVARGGTGGTTASAARTSLGLVINTDVQGYDADLVTLGAGGAGARAFLGLIIGTDVQAYDADLTTLGAGGSSARSFLGLAIGSDVQAYNANTFFTNGGQTITSATWNGSTIGVGHGGTGLASFTAGDTLYASGTTTLAKLGIGTADHVMYSTGSAPAWRSFSAQIDAALGSTRGAILYRGASGWAVLAPGTSGYVLQSGGAGADPSYVAGGVPTSRTLTLTAPLLIDGGSSADLSANRAIGMGTQSANRVLAGPTNGAAAAPDFRALVAADLPSIAHSSLTGLTSGDDHTQYALLAGRSGGQSLLGGTGSGDGLTIRSTSNGTKGTVSIGATGTAFVSVDEATPRISTQVQSSVSNAILAAIKHEARTPGAGAASNGFGLGVDTYLYNAGSSSVQASRQSVHWSDATASSEDATWTLRLQRAGTVTDAVVVNSLGQITTGEWAATTLGVSVGGTGATSASGARTALGVVPGTDVQAQDSELQALAGLTSAADKVPYFTGSGTASVTDFTSTARSLLDDTSTGAMRTTLGVAVDPATAGGRLTASSSLPVTVSDTTSATLYYLPYTSTKVALYVSSVWTQVDIGSSGPTGLDVSALTHTQNYDIFLYSNAGTPTLEALAWSTHTAGTGAGGRATALARQDGTLVKSGDATRRYLGTIRTVNSSGTKCQDALGSRLVWNWQNRVAVHDFQADRTDTWTCSGTNGTWAVVNTGGTPAKWKTNFVVGVDAYVTGVAQIGAAAITADAYVVAMAFNWTSGTPSQDESTWGRVNQASTVSSGPTSTCAHLATAGYNFFQAVETSTGSGTAPSVQGDGGGFGQASGSYYFGER